MNNKIKRSLSAFLSVALSFSFVFAFAEAEELTVDKKAESDINEVIDSGSINVPDRKLFLTDDLKASVLNIEDINEENFSDNANDLLDKMVHYGLNAVYIDPYYSDSHFTINMNEPEDKLIQVLKLADKKGLKRFVYFNLDKTLENCPENVDKTDYLVSEAHKFTLKYHCTGIILTGYYSSLDNSSYDEYMNNGSGIGYKNWLFDIVEQRFKAVCDVIKITDNTVAVGLSANDCWANIGNSENGSETESDFEAYNDGFSDTRKYCNDGFVDFISVDAQGSLSDEKINFESVIKWWDDIAEKNNLSLYVVHHNEKIGTDSIGWGSEDQLLKQLAIANELESYCGSSFYSFEALDENPLGTTDLLVKYYNQQINLDTLFEELEMTSPLYTNYATDEASVAFMGTFDENFDVYFDDEKLSLNEAGNFYFEKQLDVGLNYFTFKHKDKTITYSIERTINVMRSVNSAIAEGKILTVDGGTTISLSCSAYKGADVYAYINGQYISMKQNSTSDSDDGNSSYATYTGKYTVPEGTLGEKTYLGSIQISASYMGYSMYYYGADLIVKEISLPDSNAAIDLEIPEDQSSFGNGEVVGTITPYYDENQEVSLIRLTDNYIYIYDGYNTDPINPPNCGQLPAGTLDYYKSSWDDFYVSLSGKRYLKEDAEVISGNGIGQNALVVDSIGNVGGDSFIKMNLEDKISFTVEPIGNDYYSGYDGDFYLDSFDAQYIYITFDNVTSVTALPDFSNCSVFSDGSWKQVEVNGVPKFRLILKLRQPGVYAGNSATYDSQGNLIFKFEILTNDISNMTIVIDPGHGLTEGGYMDPGAIGHIEEQGVNLAVAKLVEAKLRDLGVNVVRLRTESTFYDTARRPYYARDYGCDLYIAIHSNKAGYETPRGTECYYYTSYSQPLAEALAENVSSYFSDYVYSDGAYMNRGDQYSYMWTTKQQDFPSVLIEMGFVSNYEDAMALASSYHQDGIAEAIVNGIKEYVRRSAISSY